MNIFIWRRTLMWLVTLVSRDSRRFGRVNDRPPRSKRYSRDRTRSFEQALQETNATRATALRPQKLWFYIFFLFPCGHWDMRQPLPCGRN